MSQLICPLDRVDEHATESGRIYRGRLFFHLKSLKTGSAPVRRPCDKPLRFDEEGVGILELDDKHYRLIEAPEHSWGLGSNDSNFGFQENLKKGHRPNIALRHLHTEFALSGRKVHIDFKGYRSGGSKDAHFLIFIDGRYAAGGGRVNRWRAGFGVSYCFDWGLAARVGEALITLEDPYEPGSFGFDRLNMRFWEPV